MCPLMPGIVPVYDAVAGYGKDAAAITVDELCHGAPFCVPGPIVTDRAPVYGHMPYKYDAFIREKT